MEWAEQRNHFVYWSTNTKDQSEAWIDQSSDYIAMKTLELKAWPKSFYWQAVNEYIYIYAAEKEESKPSHFCPGRRKGSDDDYRNRKTARGDLIRKNTADFNTADQLLLGHQAGIDVYAC